MDAMFQPANLSAALANLDFARWAQAFSFGESENVSNNSVSMESAAAAVDSPFYEHKRRRLSLLLDRLTVQIHNNNNYPSPHPRWLTNLSPPDNRDKEEVPLDLSKKPVKPEPVVVKKENGFSCGTCGQTFAVHDRLAKHIASRHRNPTPEEERQYGCDVCNRRFTRSDMLTRHARLHSGLKPYSCSVCSQVFSRSDHLSTHQRTHTGEKPYHCPACPYAACRRDMITRHMRTHARKGNTA